MWGRRWHRPMRASTPSAVRGLGVRGHRDRKDHRPEVVTLPRSTGRLRAAVGQLVKWSTGGSVHEECDMKADAPGAVLKRERVRDFILDLVESHQPGDA